MKTRKLTFILFTLNLIIIMGSTMYSIEMGNKTFDNITDDIKKHRRLKRTSDANEAFYNKKENIIYKYAELKGMVAIGLEGGWYVGDTFDYEYFYSNNVKFFNRNGSSKYNTIRDIISYMKDLDLTVNEIIKKCTKECKK